MKLYMEIGRKNTNSTWINILYVSIYIRGDRKFPWGCNWTF